MPSLREGRVRGLRIVVLSDEAERFRGALSIAAAHAASGGEAAILLQLDAVRLLVDLTAPDDAAHRAAGLPTLAHIFDEALGLGVIVMACQSGMALAGIEASVIDTRICASGPVQFLQGCRDEDRLLIV